MELLASQLVHLACLHQQRSDGIRREVVQQAFCMPQGGFSPGQAHLYESVGPAHLLKICSDLMKL